MCRAELPNEKSDIKNYMSFLFLSNNFFLVNKQSIKEAPFRILHLCYTFFLFSFEWSLMEFLQFWFAILLFLTNWQLLIIAINRSYWALPYWTMTGRSALLENWWLFAENIIWWAGVMSIFDTFTLHLPLRTYLTQYLRQFMLAH